MKAALSNQTALETLRARIREPAALEAFDRLVRAGQEATPLNCAPGAQARDFRYTSANPKGWVFSLAASKAHLVFSIRPLGVRTLALSRATLEAVFDEVRKSARGELQIVIRKLKDAEAVVEHLLSRWPAAQSPGALADSPPEVNSGAPHGIVQAVDAAQRDIWERRDLGIEEKRSLLGARLGQGVFRANVERVEGVCRITGVMDRRHLRAVHIKPWRDCSDQEKLDGCNGLMLSPHVAHLFERGYICFSDDGSLVVSQTLNSRILKQWAITPPEQPRAFRPEQKPYLAWHRERVFEKSETGRRRRSPS